MKIRYESLEHAVISFEDISCDGYCFSLGQANLIFVKTLSGIVGCGFFDLEIFSQKNIAAAKVTGIASIEELLAGKISAITPQAKELGLEPGMTGEEAVRKMCGR